MSALWGIKVSNTSNSYWSKNKVQKFLPSLKTFQKKGKKILDEKEQAALISINLCNLKYFNEIYGTEEGDVVIERMMEYFCVDNDNCFIGVKSYVDHLLLMCDCEGLSKEDLINHYENYSESFINEINRKYSFAKINLDVGMYIVNKDEDFLVAKDNARYARLSVADSYETSVGFYSESLREQSLKEASVIPNFQKAIEGHEIIVLLQPKYSVEKGKVIGAEALSRFTDAEGNIVSPALFVPILEKANIINQLDFEVLRQVIEIQKKWQAEGKELFPISVNLSRLDLLEEGVTDKITEMVETAGIPKDCIEFEFTETALVENLSTVIIKLNSLREQGFRIAIDDFGSGYNSLYVLGQIPADVIKFDRGFVLHSLNNNIGLTIMKNLVETFKEIQFDVLCEGVETKEEEERIVECGCDTIQGFLYDKPLALNDFEAKYVAC